MVEKITFYDNIAPLLDVLGGLDFIKTDADSRCVKILDTACMCEFLWLCKSTRPRLLELLRFVGTASDVVTDSMMTNRRQLCEPRVNIVRL